MSYDDDLRDDDPWLDGDPIPFGDESFRERLRRAETEADAYVRPVLDGPRGQAVASALNAIEWLKNDDVEQAESCLEAMIYWMEGGEEAFEEQLSALRGPGCELAVEHWSSSSPDVE